MTGHQRWEDFKQGRPAYLPCLGEPACEPPDGEVTPDDRQYKHEGRHDPACPHALSAVCPHCDARGLRFVDDRLVNEGVGGVVVANPDPGASS